MNPNRPQNTHQNIPDNDNTKLILYWQEIELFPKTYRYPDLCRQPIGRFCELTFDVSQHAKSDVVIFHSSRISRTKPPFKKRRGQVWVARALESPPHWRKGYASPAWRGVFNWTMTYRTDCDNFSPVGRLVRLQTTVPKKLHSNCLQEDKVSRLVREQMRHDVQVRKPKREVRKGTSKVH